MRRSSVMVAPVIAAVLCAVFLLMPATSLAAPAYGIDTQIAGGVYTVTVTVPDDSGAVIMQFALLYDAAAVELTSASAGSALAGQMSPVINRTKAGTVYFVWDSIKPLTSGGAVLTLTFKPLTDGAKTGIAFDTASELLLLDGDYKEITAPASQTTPSASPDAASTPGAATPGTATPVDTTAPDVTPGPSGEGEGNEGDPVVTPEPTMKPPEIVFSEPNVSVPVGGDVKLDAELDGVDTTGEPPVWYSSDESVATVDGDGNVTAVGEGTATITAVTTDGSASGECVITVDEQPQTDEPGAENDGGITVEAPTDEGENPIWYFVVAGVLLAAAAAIAAVLILKRRKE